MTDKAKQVKQTKQVKQAEKEPRFPLGTVYVMGGAEDAEARTGESLDPFIFRHSCGDWGAVSCANREANNKGIAKKVSLLSAYYLSDRTKILIETRPDRAATIVRTPGE
jgi:hypothetical protein